MQSWQTWSIPPRRKFDRKDNSPWASWWRLIPSQRSWLWTYDRVSYELLPVWAGGSAFQSLQDWVEYEGTSQEGGGSTAVQAVEKDSILNKRHGTVVDRLDSKLSSMQGQLEKQKESVYNAKVACCCAAQEDAANKLQLQYKVKFWTGAWWKWPMRWRI